MILVDTSVWVDHLRQAGDTGLVPLFNAGVVYGHPWVIGELVCCNLHALQEILALLKGLSSLAVASDDEVFSSNAISSWVGALALSMPNRSLPSRSVVMAGAGRATSNCLSWPKRLAWITLKSNLELLAP